MASKGLTTIIVAIPCRCNTRGQPSTAAAPLSRRDLMPPQRYMSSSKRHDAAPRQHEEQQQQQESLQH